MRICRQLSVLCLVNELPAFLSCPVCLQITIRQGCIFGVASLSWLFFFLILAGLIVSCWRSFHFGVHGIYLYHFDFIYLTLSLSIYYSPHIDNFGEFCG
jgi:hypothetical protein